MRAKTNTFEAHHDAMNTSLLIASCSSTFTALDLAGYSTRVLPALIGGAVVFTTALRSNPDLLFQLKTNLKHPFLLEGAVAVLLFSGSFVQMAFGAATAFASGIFVRDALTEKVFVDALRGKSESEA